MLFRVEPFFRPIRNSGSKTCNIHYIQLQQAWIDIYCILMASQPKRAAAGDDRLQDGGDTNKGGLFWAEQDPPEPHNC